jgi:hypothetical protein
VNTEIFIPPSQPSAYIRLGVEFTTDVMLNVMEFEVPGRMVIMKLEKVPEP